MTLELATYGFVTGWFRERYGWNGFGATAIGIAAGRLMFIATVWLTNGYAGQFGAYLVVAMLPGLYAAVAQVGVMGVVGKIRDRNA